MVMASRDRSAKANRDLRWTTESCAQGEASGFGHHRTLTCGPRRPTTAPLRNLPLTLLRGSPLDRPARPFSHLRPNMCSPQSTNVFQSRS